VHAVAEEARESGGVTGLGTMEPGSSGTGSAL